MDFVLKFDVILVVKKKKLLKLFLNIVSNIKSVWTNGTEHG